MRATQTLVLIGLVAAASACGNETTTPSAVTDASGLPADNVILGVEHNMTREGIRTGVLNSDTAYLYESSRRMDLRGVRIRFFGDTGVETGTLTSTTGEYDIGTGSFLARGDVVLLTDGPDGERRLETEELHYDVENDRLWSDVAFVMREGGSTTRGTSFQSDSQFRTWSVTGAETEGGIRRGRSGVSF